MGAKERGIQRHLRVLEHAKQIGDTRVALAGYWIADIILSAADELDMERELSKKSFRQCPG